METRSAGKLEAAAPSALHLRSDYEIRPLTGHRAIHKGLICEEVGTVQ